MGLNNINSKSTWGQAASDINTNFTTISSDLNKVKNATTKNKGFFTSLSDLQSYVKQATVGDWAYVGTSYPLTIYKYNGSIWVDSGVFGGPTMFEETDDTTNYDDVF